MSNVIRKGMHANPNILLYAGSPQFEPTGGTIVGGYGAVHVRSKRHNPNWQAYRTQHGMGQFTSFADDLAGDDGKFGIMDGLKAAAGIAVVSTLFLVGLAIMPKN